MNAVVAEWVAKAEGDFQSAQRELRARGAIKAMKQFREFVRGKL
jgi:translation elongation factor EF-Ts